MGARRKKCWSYVAGERGRNWVRAFEKARGGVLFVEWYEQTEPGCPLRRKRASLGHRDREQAKAAADEIAAAFAAGDRHGIESDAPVEPTVHDLLDGYLASETRYKSPSKQGHDRRAASTFKAFFARTRKADSLNLGDWNGFIRARREGRVGPPSTVRKAQSLKDAGLPFPAVGDRQIEYDLRFLWAVLNWATKNGDGEGRLLLPGNPLARFVTARDWPRERNPERPSLTEEQYCRMLLVAPEVDWRFHAALVLVHETGHRIGSVRRLRWEDLEVRQGWIRWPKETDKVGWEHATPLTAEALGALRNARCHRENKSVAWVFPSPGDPGRACSRNIMRDWWNKAQAAAGLDGVKRLGWHSLRRKFANDLRQVPLKDLASLGGWKDTQTLLKCYLKEDEHAMVEALKSRRSPHTRRPAGMKNGPRGVDE